MPQQINLNYNYDPELAPFVATLPVINLTDIAAARTSLKEMVQAMNTPVDISAFLEALEVGERKIPGPKGAPKIPIRIYMPKHRKGLVPSLLYIHGGGFVLGDLDQEHSEAAMISSQLGVAVISVDYRLAPENPFPAGLQDCYATLEWMHANASELSIDIDHIGVCGQSAGGGLAAAVTLLARDRGGPNLCFQFLGIPELDDRLETISMRKFVDTPGWNRFNAELSWKYYLGESIQPGSADVSPYAAPARATNLSGLPPACVAAMEFDPLRDEDIIYALRLLDAGVSIELHVYPGTFHGAALLPFSTVSQRARSEMIEALRRGFHVSLEKAGE